MARAALNIGIRDLATAADISPNTVARLERGEPLHRRTLAHVQATLEAQGVVFVSRGPGSAWPGPIIGCAPERRLAGQAKLLSDLWSLPSTIRHEPETAFNSLLDVCEAYLNIIQSENREPDAWERKYLNEAVNALQRCSLSTAYVCIRCGISPPDNQAREYLHPDDDAASFADLTMAYFRTAIIQVRAKGFQERWVTRQIAENPKGA